MAEARTLQQRLAGVFTQQLGLEPPEPDADLFASGIIDSLAFVNMLFAIEREFGVRVSLEQLRLERFQSLAKIAEFIAENVTPAGEGGPVKINTPVHLDRSRAGRS